LYQGVWLGMHHSSNHIIRKKSNYGGYTDQSRLSPKKWDEMSRVNLDERIKKILPPR